jgi:hypothetical protein
LPRSVLAQDFARAGLLFCVSQVSILNGRPPTPPLALSLRMWIFAAASAGPSNGAISPLLSNAQPITIAGLVAAEVSLLAPASAAIAAAVPRTAAAATHRRFCISLTPLPLGLPDSRDPAVILHLRGVAVNRMPTRPRAL